VPGCEGHASRRFGEVADAALERTYSIVTHLLAGRPDVLKRWSKNRNVSDHHRQGPGLYRYAGIPEPSEPGYQNERVRGTGGKPTSFGEENLLSLSHRPAMTTKASPCMNSAIPSTARCARLIRLGGSV